MRFRRAYVEGRGMRRTLLFASLFAYSVFEGELSDAIPVVHASIGGCRILGTLCSGGQLCVCIHL